MEVLNSKEDLKDTIHLVALWEMLAPFSYPYYALKPECPGLCCDVYLKDLTLE